MVAFDVDVGNVRFVAVLIVGLVLIGSHLALLCHRCKRIIQRSIQRKGVGRLPVARPVRQASVLNLIVFKGGDFLAVVVIMLRFLHTLDHFFGLDAVAKDIQQVDDLHILVGGIFQSIVHPAVGLTADIDKQVAVGNFDNIISSWLIAVQVNAVVQQHCDFSVVSLVTEDFFDPIVFGEDGGDNAQFVSLIGIVLLSAAGKNADERQKRKQQRSYFFHRDCYLQIMIRA